MEEEKPKIEEKGIQLREITEEMKDSYIDYAMSVIVSRALPDVRDGLKPVHRRILYAMYEDGLAPSAKFRKSANVVGSVLGRYHPHGDIAVYDALARMVQDFSLRYPLVAGQGNWGSIDGDNQAAMRYTECKMSKIGEEMLQDIKKDTVNFRENYDGTRKEPIVLPSPVPQLLLNGSLGIAVGMATNIPPHNLTEVTDALIHIIDHPKAASEDMYEFIKGPDFPTGGMIYGKKDIIAAYSQGKGPIVVRGKAEVVESKTGKTQIIISEIPFQVQKSSLIEQLANLVQEKKIDRVKDIRDESDKDGMRIAIDLQKDAYPNKILNRLYKFTDLQKTFHMNMLALTGGIYPKILSLVEILNFFIEHRKEVVVRRAEYELAKAKEREHVLEGLHKCLDKIDAVIRVIRASKDREDAKNNLIKGFKLSEIQANAILETKLSALAKLERKKIEEELKEIREKIKEYIILLASPAKIKEVVKKELKEIKEKYGDERKTKVYVQGVGEIAEEDLIPQEETIITLTQGGYIKRINPSTYKIQKRGGKGILGMKTMQEDVVEHFLPANTHDALLFFTDSGKVFRTPAYEIPEANRVARGRGLSNFIEIASSDKILSVMSFGKEDKESGTSCLVMITKDGVIKKTNLEEFDNVRRSGLIAINLKKGDALRRVVKSSGKNDIIIVTQKGQSIRFKEKDVRPMGRQASGIRAIRLGKGHEVIGMKCIEENGYLLVLSENGYGKRTDAKEYRLQGRGGSGIKTSNVTSKTGNMVFSKVLINEEDEDLIVISEHGQVIRTAVSSVPKLSRATQGVRIMRLDEGDKVASAACI
ncbi:MAG: DNA gyrase subunit A [bacterium]|nr:DNA gyrase subunit A [bacterium]